MPDEQQGATPKIEGAEKPTLLEAKPTVKTYTEKDFGKAVSKGLESMQRQLDLQKAEADKAKAELKSKEFILKSREEDLAELEKLKFDEDPEVKDAYISKKAIREAQRKVDEAKAKVEDQQYEFEKAKWDYMMEKKAKELVADTGIDINEFVGCKTEGEMEVKALRFKLENLPVETKEEKFVTLSSPTPLLSDKDFLKSFSEGKRNSPEDYERANKLLGVIPSSAFKR